MGQLFHGDNKDVLAFCLPMAIGKVKLLYIDPPSIAAQIMLGK
jgi:hypothetical protein